MFKRLAVALICFAPMVANATTSGEYMRAVADLRDGFERLAPSEKAKINRCQAISDVVYAQGAAMNYQNPHIADVNGMGVLLQCLRS